MPRFGKSSSKKLETCHADIQEIMKEVIKFLDITIIYGTRTEEQQNKLFAEGKSELLYPNSKHNSTPSMAIDIMLWNKDNPRIGWDDKQQMQFIAGYIKAVADSKGIKIRLGADWNDDLIFDENFYDGAHIELV